MRGVGESKLRGEKYDGCRIFSKQGFRICFLEGGGTAVMMPDGRGREEAVMEARLRLENQHLRLGL